MNRQQRNRDFDRDFDRLGKGIGVLWVVSAPVSLALTAATIWALVLLVQWVVSK